MTTEYSIELQAENIDNHKTKQYFQEVLSSYINGNYRSAIVVLWTVTICDLIYKLQDLQNIFEDKSAKKILMDIEKKQNDNKKSPQWETDLVELINDRTNLFETYEFTHIQSLQQHRHLSAHPIIKDDLELYQPNKETTRAHIRNILEAVLTKPPLASNKIFTMLIEDISDKKDLFPDRESLKKYLESSFLKNTQESVIKNLFKKLWKFCFYLDDEKVIENKLINTRALSILFANNQDTLLDYMKTEEEYFGQNIRLNEDSDLEYFVLLCAKYPKLYYSISVSFQIPIKEKIKQNKSWNIQAFFLYSKAYLYFNDLKNIIGFTELEKSKDIANNIKGYCTDNDSYTKMLNIFILAFKQSANFSSADVRFNNLIEPFLDEMTEDMLLDLIRNIDDDFQLYGRNSALNDNKIIKNKCDEIFNGDFDYTQYPNFIENMRED